MFLSLLVWHVNIYSSDLTVNSTINVDAVSLVLQVLVLIIARP